MSGLKPNSYLDLTDRGAMSLNSGKVLIPFKRAEELSGPMYRVLEIIDRYGGLSYDDVLIKLYKVGMPYEVTMAMVEETYEKGLIGT